MTDQGRVVPPEGGPRPDEPTDEEMFAEFGWAKQKWHDAWSGQMDNTGPSVILEIVKHAYRTGRASGAGTRQEEADTLHWLRGELCDLLDITVGDDQYPWNAILEKLKARLAEGHPK